jgi:nucleoid-associated protein EbfC
MNMNPRDLQRMQREMQRKLEKMQEELEVSQFTGTAGGGAVTITMNGKLEMTAVKIDPEAFNAEDIAELEVMVLSAARDAFKKASEAQERLASGVTGGLKIPGLF